MADEQAKKNFLIKVGVATIMALVFIFWLLNIKNVFISEAQDSNQTASEVANLKKDFADTINQMGESLAKVEERNNELNAASSSLINELIIETNKVASSSEATLASSTLATSSQISTSSFPIIPVVNSSTNKTKFDCPAYIDCMPTVGAARPCQIPVGCEGITQIAY